MLCVSIAANSPTECANQCCGSSMVELRADLCNLSHEEVARFVSTTPNVLITWHTTPDTEPIAERTIEVALEAGARWVDVEIHASEGYRKRIIEKAHKCGAEVVISYHNYSSTPSLEQLIATTNDCFDKGADIAKVITTASTTTDGATTLALYDHFTPNRLIAFAMGKEGAFTRRLSLLLGAPWGYVAPADGEKTAPGQFTAEELGGMLGGGQPLTITQIPSRTIIPATKSAAQRAIVCAMLAKGVSRIENFAACGDSLAALRVAEQLGCRVESQGDTLIIHSCGADSIRAILNTPNISLHTGESGLLTRLMLPIVGALTDSAEVCINGGGTLTRRSMGESIDALRSAGVEVCGSGEDGCRVPMKVRGPIREQHIVIDGSSSSQVASGLMLTLPLLPQGTTLTIQRPTSRPYLALTEQVMASFGPPLIRNEEVADALHYQSAHSADYSAATIRLESDWSSAGYFAAAYALAQSGVAGGKWVRGEYLLEGMTTHTAQADEVIVDILRKCGSNIVEDEEQNLHFLPSEPLRPMDVDASNFPDLVPTLAIVALFANGQSRIGGLHRLGAKESNRTEAIYCELKALGANISIEGDYLVVSPAALHAPVGDAPLCSYGDHRMVMSLAIASIFVGEPLRIDSIEPTSKSFPTFFDKFNTHK